MRMDKYNDNEEEKEEVPLKRTVINQDIYDDIYMNNKYVDINNIFDSNEEKEKSQETEKEVINFEKKNYSIDDYLSKAHERLTPDSNVRNLDDKEFIKQEGEISKLIESINKEEQENDFFSDLIGNNEDTMIEGQLQKEEVSFTYEEFRKTIYEEEKLNNVLGDETISNLELKEDEENHAFRDIVGNTISKKKKRKLSLIVFFITLIMLILVILIIIFK